MRLLVAPASAVDRLLASQSVDHVLVLASPDIDLRPLDRPATVLRFNDIVTSRSGLVEPSLEMISKIIGLRNNLPAEATLLVHCYAGVSRSPAAAYILACAADAAGEEFSIARRLRTASPQATPNGLMVALADDLLGRGGAMTRSIRAIGRGVDAFEGSVIDWTLPSQRSSVEFCLGLGQ